MWRESFYLTSYVSDTESSWNCFARFFCANSGQSIVLNYRAKFLIALFLLPKMMSSRTKDVTLRPYPKARSGLRATLSIITCIS